ncbi:phage portal protein [Flavobacterium sp. CYK-4]|uniref:phage portal protein n=1 Tax=Flavobacterium lotistagni TaxID=2709660 RepID=UPI00140945B3|nr:phage portal protein [Flavobacterium lotistagni]NHM07999.1 phage portal protein [Flavobacterium lotistagni]
MSLNQAFSMMFSSGEKRGADSVSYFNDFTSFFLSDSKAKTSSLNYKASLKLSAVFNAVEQISNDIAKIPFFVYKVVENGSERFKAHPVDWLLSTEPNPFMTSFIWKKVTAISLLLRGNSLSKIETNHKGDIIELTFIDWDDVLDIKKVAGEILYFVRGYDKPLLSSEVLHFKNFTHNGFVGVGVITYAAQQMNLAIEVQQFSITNFENKGVRTGVIETDKTLNADPNKPGEATPKQKIKTAWSSAMAQKSPDRIVVLDDGLKFKAINITPQEAQIIEMSRFTVEDIARWFNIAPHKIKSLQQSTNNNIEQQSLDHVSDTMQPYVTNIEQELSKKLFSNADRKSYFVKGNMNVLLRADMKTRSEAICRYIMTGVYTRNQGRLLEDQNAGPAMLDEYLTPVNTFTESQIEDNLKEKKNE